MTRFPLARLLLVGLALVLAGCTENPGAPRFGNPLDSAPEARVLDAFLQLPAPALDAPGAVTEWETFVNTYPKRDWLLPHNLQAADYLATELAQAGYAVARQTFPADLGPAPGLVPAPYQVVRGVLAGADSTHRFALVAHYDTVATTIQGAYDDGAGTIAQLNICRLLAEQRARLQHTVECLFFDAEEQGLKASRAFVDWYRAEARGFEYDLVFGYDMTGINWPGHAWNLYAMIGTDTPDLSELTDGFHAFLDLAYGRFLEGGPLPGARDGIAILDVHDRNSDEQNFKRAGIPVVRFAGGRKAVDYPQYHDPLDTPLYVYDFVGGRANFEKGYDAVIRTSYYTILGFDAFNPRSLPTAD